MDHLTAAEYQSTDLDLVAFQRRILDWYDVFRRDLPWRGDPNPYHILISEVMLQQTGVPRVIPTYNRFLATFPTLESLANASTADVLRAWQGLGYNRRAVNLKRLASVVVEEHQGQLPSAVEALQRLPGIGSYTARAIACFAFGTQVAVIDTNIRRVLSSFAGRQLSEKEIEELAVRLLPQGRASDWNQALMDYGSLVQRAQPSRRSKSQEVFATSNRYWRGRIIDALREHDTLGMSALLSILPENDRDEQRVRSLILALHDEGLVAYDAANDDVALPG
jgi:A/G-specific adenine glycosylase